MAGRVIAAVLLAACAVPLTGCTSADRTPAAPAEAATTPAVPVHDAALARFRAAIAPLARRHAARGMDYVDALHRAGWSLSALHVTADRTAVGLEVPAIQVAARDAAGCLIAQVGAGPLTVVRAAPVEGACLIGSTRDLG